MSSPEENLTTAALAHNFAQQHSIDIAADIDIDDELWTPRLVPHGENGSVIRHLTDDKSGTDYDFIQLDYLEGDVVQKSRMIGRIAAGKHTEIAYWTEAAPTKELTIHQGKGSLVVGNPSKQETSWFSLDPEVISYATLRPGRFYIIRAIHRTGDTPLVVSGIYPPGINWDELEISLQPGGTYVDAPEGRIHVPELLQLEYLR